MRSVRSLRLIPILALAAFVSSACADATGPASLDADALEADLAVANNAVAAPAVISFTAVGSEINRALALLGGGSAVVDLPAALVVNPKALVERAELRARVRSEFGEAAAIPAAAVGGASPRVDIDGLLTSASGRVRIAGTIQQATGGTLTVTVNERTFATIQVDSVEDDSPTILNGNGEPLSEREQYLLRKIFEWFEHAFDTYEDLLDPVEHLLDIAF